MTEPRGERAGEDYHSLLSLHHAMRLRRQMRGEAGPAGAAESRAAEPARLSPPAPDGPSWPEHLDDRRQILESLRELPPLDRVMAHLYQVLFRDRPHLRTLFPESIDHQPRRLAAALRSAIDSEQPPELLAPVFIELGREHQKLGVRRAHFTAFAGALTEALRHTGGSGWRTGWEPAWLRAYWYLAGLMIVGVEERTTAPPYFDATVVGHDQRRPGLAVIQVSVAGPYPFRAGQHAAVQAPQLPRAWRQYSIACPPNDDDLLEFHVRAREFGGLADMLVHRCKVGDHLRVGPARGEFVLPRDTGHELLLVAGGTGLAALKAILGELLRAARPRRTTLFFGARTRADLYDLDRLTELAAGRDWLTLVPVVADPESAGGHQVGTLPEVVAARGPWQRHRALVAGPPGLVDAMRRELPGQGIPAELIGYDPERFTGRGLDTRVTW